MLKKETIEYKQDGAFLEGYLAYDDAQPGKRPGIVVMHEWKGLNDYAKHRADMLAELGYVAFAADIYGKGIRPQTVSEASQISGQYIGNRPLFRARAKAALDVLRSRPNVDTTKLAAIGYCFGGAAALELGRSGAELKGIVTFHGALGTPTPQDAQNIKAKVLVLHGADDSMVKPVDVAAFEKEMKDARVDYRLIQYPGAIHGFSNPSNKGQVPGVLYQEAADKASWQETQSFFKLIFS